MANTVKHGKGSKVIIGDYDFSGQGRSIDLTVFEADMADATVFTSLARVKSPGSYSAKIDHKGIFTNVVSGWDNWLHSKLGSMSGQPISVLLGEPANGDIAYHGEILTSNVKVPVKIDDVIGTEATYEIHRALARGTLLAWQTSNIGGTAFISGITGTKYQVGPCNANEQYQLTIHVLTHINSGALTVKVQYSSGDSIYADLAGASVVTGANSGDIGSAIVRVTGSADDYLQVAIIQQGGTNPQGMFAVAASKLHKSE